MPHGVLDDFPLDICDRILTLISDFSSLQNAVLSSKQLHEAWSSRKLSLMRAVVSNQVGPALPFAAALVRTKNMLGEEPLQDILEGLNTPDPESELWAINVTAAEAKKLESVSCVVRRLESFFSVLYKDRAAPVSALSEVESFRLHRAIYRIWIISVLANDQSTSSRPTGLKMTFLENMPEEELVEMQQTMQFISELYVALWLRHSRFHGAFFTASRPLQLQLDAFLAQFDGYVGIENLGNSLTRSGSAIVNGFNCIQIERQVVKLFREKYNSQAILTNPRIEDVQACQKCTIQTTSLHGENNWHLLHYHFHLDDLLGALPGRLQANACVRVDFSALLGRRPSYTTVLSDMFDIQTDPQSDWDRSKWLCVGCVKEFFQERLYSWFVSELVKDRYNFKEDCWYGWNCRTQTHRMEHAKKLNHLCEPTNRDDDTRAAAGIGNGVTTGAA